MGQQQKDNQYYHLTQEEREFIATEKGKGMSFRQVARELGRSHTTISRERKRNSIDKGWGKLKYSPGKAEEKYKKRRYKANQDHIILWKDHKMRKRLIKLIEEKGRKRGIDEIVGRLNLEGYRIISTSSVYRFIRYDEPRLQSYLLYGEKGYRTKGKGNKRKKTYTDVPNIAERPKEVESRKVIGHREGDTVVSGRIGKGGIVSMYERSSRYYLIKKVNNLKAETVKIVLETMMKGEKIETATFDNGVEFWKISELRFQCYRADPYASYQRGGNEKHNGLFRREIPKGSDICVYSDEEIQKIQDNINHKPRKILGYRTPYEVYHGEEIKYIK